jgi:hypothetical protein
LSLCCALTGLKDWLIFTQGVAMGWYVVALSGLRKKLYTLVDLSVTCGLNTIPLANARGSDSLTCLITEPRALASGIVFKPQVKHANRKDTHKFMQQDEFDNILFLTICI